MDSTTIQFTILVAPQITKELCQTLFFLMGKFKSFLITLHISLICVSLTYSLNSIYSSLCSWVCLMLEIFEFGSWLRIKEPNSGSTLCSNWNWLLCVDIALLNINEVEPCILHGYTYWMSTGWFSPQGSAISHEIPSVMHLGTHENGNGSRWGQMCLLIWALH